MDSPEIAAAVAALALVIAGLARSAIPKPARPALAYMWRRLLPVFATLALAGCGGSIPAVSSSQPSDIYLENTLDWIQEHALPRDGTDWESIRRDALAMAMHPQTTAETYPAIRFALSNLRDSSAFFLEPREFAELTDLGVTALYPGGTVVFVQPHSPAAAAGVREGDTLESVNGDGLRPHGSEPREGDSGTWFVEMGHTSTYRLALRPADQTQVMTLDVPQTSGRYDGEPISRRIAGRADALRNVGYIELPWDGGWADYATRVQRAIRAADSAETCSWIVDVRRNIGGDFWTYVAGVGPILGEDDLGGFSFPSGARERWAYEGGKVLWDGRQRDESYVADPVYTLKHRRPPVAVLTSRATFSAGELLRVAFQGRSNTRSFGEPTGGKPVLQLHTTLSDGAHVSIGAAYAFDRTGRTYTGPVSPDETVTTDWARFGGADDPVVAAALAWLRTQSGCGD